MVLLDEITTLAVAVKEIGIGAIVIYFLYKIVLILVNRLNAQADTVMNMAQGIIKENTEAMGKMHDVLRQMEQALIKHTNQKDKLIDAIQDQTETVIAQMKECKNGRDKKLAEILRKP